MTPRTHTLRVPGAVPGLALRLLIVALVMIGAALLVPYALWQWIAVISALAGVIIPRSMASWLAAGCLVFGVALAGPAPERTALAVLLVHLIHVLAGLTLVVPLRSRVALRMLRPTTARLLVVQLIAQPIALGVWLLSPAPGDHGPGWIAPLAAVAFLLGVLAAVRTLRAEGAVGR